MLQELTIRDFAIIEKMDLEFQSQMTVLTGETGAGKSIIIGSINLALGEKVSLMPWDCLPVDEVRSILSEKVQTKP